MKSLTNQVVVTTLLKEQLKRFWIIALVPLLVYLLTIILPLHNTNEWNPAGQTMSIIDILSMSHATVIFAMVLVPFAVVMALYPYNFSKRATSAFYSFPITKRQLFWTNFVAGTVLILVPLLLLTASLLVPIEFAPYGNVGNAPWDEAMRWSNVRLPYSLFPEWMQEGTVVNSFRHVAMFFARTALGFMFYFAVFLVAVTVAGSRVIAVLLSMVLSLIPVAVHILVRYVAYLYVFGVDMPMDMGARTVQHTNPVLWSNIINASGFLRFGQEIGEVQDTNFALYFIIYIVIAIALIIVAYVCSRFRRHERTGDSVVFVSLKNICVFMLAMTGMIVLSAVLVAMIGGRFWWYIGAVLGFTIAYFIGQMIAEKTLNIFREKGKHLLYFGGTMLGIYVVMLLFTTFGMGFYTNRVPDINKIESVSLSHSWAWNRTAITDPDTIAGTIAMHNEILEHRSYLRGLRWSTQGHGASFHSIPISYTLHDGSTISRMYYVSTQFWERPVVRDLFNSTGVILADLEILRRPEMVASVSLNIRDGDGDSWHDNIVFRGDMVAPLLEAIQIDYMRDRRSEDWMVNSLGWVNVNVELYPRDYQSFIRTWMSLTFYSDGEVARWLAENMEE